VECENGECRNGKPFPAACHDNPAALPKGLLTVNLQGTLATRFVVPALPEFLQHYPGVELQIGEGDRLVDLVREGSDSVLRAGNLQDSPMVARRVAEPEQVACVGTACLKWHGTPKTLDDLDKHQAVNIVSSDTGKPMPLEFDTGNGIRLVALPRRVSVLYPHNRQLSSRVRVFAEWIRDRPAGCLMHNIEKQANHGHPQ